MHTPLWAIGIAVIGSGFASLASLFLKIGGDGMKSLKTIIFNKHLYLGAFIYGFATVCALIAYSSGDLSVIYPVYALSYVWTCLLSIKFLKEHMNPWKWIGVATIILGVFLISFGA